LKVALNTKPNQPSRIYIDFYLHYVVGMEKKKQDALVVVGIDFGTTYTTSVVIGTDCTGSCIEGWILLTCAKHLHHLIISKYLK
jgi:hypothetical protein